MTAKEMEEFVAKISNDIAEEIDNGETRAELRGCIQWLSIELGLLRIRLPDAEENAQLRRLLGPSLEDSARLDWLEKHALDFEFNFKLNGATRKNYASGCVLRPVIDAAIKATA